MYTVWMCVCIIFFVLFVICVTNTLIRCVWITFIVLIVIYLINTLFAYVSALLSLFYLLLVKQIHYLDMCLRYFLCFVCGLSNKYTIWIRVCITFFLFVTCQTNTLFWIHLSISLYMIFKQILKQIHLHICTSLLVCEWCYSLTGTTSR